MLIENSKTYKGQELESIFFRPTFCGKSAEEMGIRVIYNMPLPTTVQMWSRPSSVLRSFSSGWSGGTQSTKVQKTIDMKRVKAETSFSASDYFSMVFEKITALPDVNLQDLSGTELEKAETELFRQAIAENVRAAFWLGDTTGTVSNLTTFDGILKHIHDCIENDDADLKRSSYFNEDLTSGVELLDNAWNQASPELKSLRSEGQLAYFVSSEVMLKYQKFLDAKGADGAYHDLVNGRQQVYYHGIPVIEVPLGKYSDQQHMYTEFCMLTDRRNLVLALNTSDNPENEVRMWYNPDEMENRQRAVFLVGTEIMDPTLVSVLLLAD